MALSAERAASDDRCLACLLEYFFASAEASLTPRRGDSNVVTTVLTNDDSWPARVGEIRAHTIAGGV